MVKRRGPFTRDLHGPIITPERRKLIKALQDLDGVIEDKSGRAGVMLRELAGAGSLRSNILKYMEHDGIISREMNVKRCYRIELTPLFREFDTTAPPPWIASQRGKSTKSRQTVTIGTQEVWGPATVTDNGRGRPHAPSDKTPASSPTAEITVEETEEETPDDRYTGLARAVLAEVLDLKVELARRLREVDIRDAEEVEQYKLVNAELRHEVERLHVEGEDLKERLHQAEHNNAELISKVNKLEFQLDAARKSVRKQISPHNAPIVELTQGGQEAWDELDRLLREPPHNHNH
jgi:hypothetical protein